MRAGRLGAAPALNVGREALRSAAGCLPSSLRPLCAEPVEPPPAPPPWLPPVVPPLLPPAPPLPPPPEPPDGAGAGGAGKLIAAVEPGASTSPPLALRRRATIANCWLVPLTSEPN